MYIGKIISREFKKTVLVDNDANAAAIGELTFGSGKKYKSFIMITLGTGVGGGIGVGRRGVAHPPRRRRGRPDLHADDDRHHGDDHCGHLRD